MVLHTEQIKSGEYSRWPYTLEYQEKEPKKDGYKLVGWNFAGKRIYKPFPEEQDNPFGPVIAKMKVTPIWQEESTDDGYFEPIIENNTGTTSLKLLEYGVDSKGNFRLGADFDKTTSTSKIWAFSCAGSVYAEFDKNNTGGIKVNASNIKNYSMLDDYGIIFQRTLGYGSWQGGNSDSGSYSRTIDVSPIKDTSIVRHVEYKGYVDENNNILLRGEIVNKAIRIPSSGMNGKIDMWQYPYTFDSLFYYTDPIMTYITKTGKTQLTRTVATNNTLNTNGFVASLENTNNSISYRVNYSIDRNNTGDYKYHMLVINSKGNPITSSYGTNANHPNIVMLHFLQEYKVKNRIYYGYGFTVSKTFDDNYNETESSSYDYHCWFETCSSKILIDDSVTIDINEDYVAYPNSVYFEYNFGLTNGGTAQVIRNNYIWGDELYTIVKIPTNNKAIFTKK